MNVTPAYPTFSQLMGARPATTTFRPHTHPRLADSEPFVPQGQTGRLLDTEA